MTNFPYKRIISYGCSLTAGSELTDHEFMGITEDELFEYVKKHKFTGSHDLFRVFNLSPNTIKEILAKNASKSWPNYVAKHFGVDILNRAIPGSSLGEATYNILKDLYDGRINDDDLVLVGITSPSRWFQFDEKGEKFGGVFGWMPISEYSTQLEMNWANPYNIVYSHYKEITFLSDLSDRLNGQIKLCYTFGAPQYITHFYGEELKDSKFAEFFDFSISLLPLHNFIDHENSICEIASWITPETHHVFGHPRVQFHEQFSEILIEKLEKMYND